MNDNEITVRRALRIYRNALVAFLRERFNQKYADHALDQLKTPFGKKDATGKTQWERMQQNAQLARIHPEISTDVADGFELLGPSDFYVVIEKFWDDLTPYTSGDEAISQTRKKGVLRCIQQVRIFRDPNAHEVTEPVDDESVLTCLLSGKSVLQALELNDAASQFSELLNEVATRFVTLQVTVVPVGDRVAAKAIAVGLERGRTEVHIEEREISVNSHSATIGTQETQNIVIAVSGSTLEDSHLAKLVALVRITERMGLKPILVIDARLNRETIRSHLHSQIPHLSNSPLQEIPYVAEYEGAVFEKIKGALKKNVSPKRVRAVPIVEVAAFQPVHDEKFATTLFSTLKDPLLTEVVIVTPFLTDFKTDRHSVPLALTLIQAKTRGCKITVITRPPTKGEEDYDDKMPLLRQFERESIEIFVNPILHAKLYLFKRGEHKSWMIGSHNLTRSAIARNLETSLLGHREREYLDAHNSYVRIREHYETTRFNFWAAQAMKSTYPKSKKESMANDK